MSFKLAENVGSYNRTFGLVELNSKDVEIENIHLTVQPVSKKDRVNKNQTQIVYYQSPVYKSFSATGAVENEKNIWIHLIRTGFFGALETAPFPYVQFPVKSGASWSDEIRISEIWSNELWGEWDGNLFLSLNYRVEGQEEVVTDFGTILCTIIQSEANSSLGTTKLKMYFSSDFGFVKMEYKLLNGLEVDFMLTEVLRNQTFADTETFIRTRKYLK
jgi:hypothetical protein